MAILDFVFHEFWVYGFVLTIFYKDPLSIAAIALVYITIPWAALKLELAPEQQFEWQVYGTVSVVSGIITAVFFIWALRSPRLIDLRFFREPRDIRNTKSPRTVNPHTLLYWLGVLMAYAGYYYVNGDFSDGANTVPVDTATGVGWALIVGGLLVFILTLIHALVTRYDYREKRLDVKYTLALIPILITPVIYDYQPNDTLRKYGGFIYIAVVILVYVGLFFYIGAVGWGADPKKKWTWRIYSKRWSNNDRFETRAHAYRIWISMGIIHVLTISVYYATDKATDRKVAPPVYSLVISSLVWILLCLFLRQLFARSDTAPLREALDRREHQATAKPLADLAEN